MSRAEILTLKRMCSKSETYSQALTLLNAAKLKTGAGTGYDLGQGASGLPAICVLIASEQLKNKDVSRKVAQVASCLAPKIFESSLNVVLSAFGAGTKNDSSSLSKLNGHVKVSYKAFIERFGWQQADFIAECMEDVEFTLTESRELKGKLAPPNTIVTVVIFCWVCIVLNLKNASPNALQEEFRISSKDFGTVEDVINGTCDVVKEDILRKVKTMRAQKSAAVPLSRKASHRSPRLRKMTTIPSPRSLSKVQPPPPSPTKSALKIKAFVENSPSRSPSHKRKVAFTAETDEDNEETYGSELETPSRKKRKVSEKVSFPSPFSSAERLPALILTPGHPVASSSKLTIDVIPVPPAEPTDVQSENDDEETTMLVDAPDVTATAPAPSTPQRPRRSTNQTLPPNTPGDFYGTPSRSIKKSHSRSQASEPDDEAAMPRRTRPVLLGYKQWYTRDPRVERELKLAEAAKRNLVERFGHPFEHLKQAAIKASLA